MIDAQEEPANGRNHDQGNQKLGLPPLRGYDGVVQRGMPQLPTERWIMYGLRPGAEDQAAAFAQRMQAERFQRQQIAAQQENTKHTTWQRRPLRVVITRVRAALISSALMVQYPPSRPGSRPETGGSGAS